MKKEVLDIAEKIDADASLSKINLQLSKAISNKDIKKIEELEEKANRVNLNIVDSEIFATYDELYSEAFIILAKHKTNN